MTFLLGPISILNDQNWVKWVRKWFIFKLMYFFKSANLQSIGPGLKMTFFAIHFDSKLPKFGKMGSKNVHFHAHPFIQICEFAIDWTWCQNDLFWDPYFSFVVSLVTFSVIFGCCLR